MASRSTRWSATVLPVLCMAALLGIPFVVSAAPVQTGDFPGPVEILDGAAGVDFDIDGDTVDDLNLTWYGVSVNSIFAWSAVVRAPTETLTTQILALQDENLVNAAERFAAGQLIGPGGSTSTFSEAAYEDFFAVTEGGAFLDLLEAQRGYVGFSFDIGGATHWGWADISVDATGDTGAGRTLLHGYGYETAPDTAVPAGAVPEPTTALLAAIGAAGAVNRLRRR